MLEAYFKKPILYDYLVSAFFIITIIMLKRQNYFHEIEEQNIKDLSSDIAGIGFTISGFILTLITILMTLRSNQILSEEEIKNSSSPFKIFLNSPLYYKSINILRMGVLSLIIICFVIFVFKLFYFKSLSDYLLYLNVVGLVIIVSTFLRCFYVLNLILKMQHR